jgi:hypothetical protein
MHICPHCKSLAVSNLAVRWSYREHPARCVACGGLSHVLASTSSGIVGTGMILVALTAAAAIVLSSYPVAVAGLAVTVAQNIWAWRGVELFPIGAEEARIAARRSGMVAIVLLVFRMFST